MHQRNYFWLASHQWTLGDINQYYSCFGEDDIAIDSAYSFLLFYLPLLPYLNPPGFFHLLCSGFNFFLEGAFIYPGFIAKSSRQTDIEAKDSVYLQNCKVFDIKGGRDNSKSFREQ